MEILGILVLVLLAVAGIGGLMFLFGTAAEVSAAADGITEQINADAAKGQQSNDAGLQVRELALERMKSGWIPDPDTEFERTLLIDGIDMQMQQAGMQMPESIRTMLTYLTVDELKESMGNII